MSMNPSLILVQKVEDGIAALTLNRPAKRNALNIVLLQELCQQLEFIRRDPSVRVLLIKGAGPVFCAGLDLDDALDYSRAEESSDLLARTVTDLLQMPCVTIAVLQGAAFAGGIALSAACDFAIASAEVQMGFPEVHRGLVPALIGILLQPQISLRNLRELFYLGEPIQAEQALSFGLINEIASSENLWERTLDRARKLLKGAPEALKITKGFLNSLSYPKWKENLHDALIHHQKSRLSSEAAEGIRAFKEKRLPAWIRN